MDRWLKMGSSGSKRKSENEDSDRKKNKPTEEEQLSNLGVVCTGTDMQSDSEMEAGSAGLRFGLQHSGLNLRGNMFGLMLVKMVNLGVVFVHL